MKLHRHSGLSERPIVNLCWFKLDLPTLILVSKVLPLEKCLYLGGLSSCLELNFKLNSFWEGIPSLPVDGKNELLNISPLYLNGMYPVVGNGHNMNFSN